MKEFQNLFRKRLGISANLTIKFDMLDDILEKTATTFPFENLCIMSNRTRSITKESLMEKVLVKKEGGLCYELNPLLYFFLLDNEFDVKLIRGNVFNQTTNSWSNLGGTHIAILLQHKGQTYLVDTGFGGNLPLKPVPLEGQITTSRNGDFRVKTLNGDYILEMKLKDRDVDWKIGYAFDPHHPVEDMKELNEIQRMIRDHEKSNFNKTPLITQLTRDGHLTLTHVSFTQWKDGQSHKEQIDHEKFKELAQEHFGFHIKGDW